MKLFEHYILTRFNIVIHDWQMRFPNHRAFTCRDSWTNERLNMFENYCLPSMRNQSLKNFKWIIVFDESTKVEHRKIIDRYTTLLDRIIIIYTNEEKYLHDVKQAIGSNFEYLITTRLDSDDALDEHAVRSLQGSFDEQEFEFVNFCNGYQYDIQNKRLLFHTSESSPFMSLIEKKNTLKTVWVEQHQDIIRKYKIKQMGNRRYWLQVLHDMNLVNLRGSGLSARELCRRIRCSSRCAVHDFLKPIIFKKKVLRSFGIEI